MGLQGREHATIGVAGAFLAVSWVAFSLRTFVKGFIMRSFGLDDWLMFITILIFTVDSGLLITVGSGLRNVEVATIYVTYQVFQSAFYTLANVFLKASLAITFDRLFLERWQRIVVQVVVGIHTAFGLATFFVTIFRCGDPTEFFTHYNHAMCISWDAMQAIQYANSVINTSAGWLLTFLPIIALRSHQMNHQTKISACLILILGCTSSIMSMPRFGFLHALGGTGAKFWTNAYPVAVLGVAEVGTGVTAACLLTLRPLIRSWRERSETHCESPRIDDMEDAEFGQAKAVSMRSVSASSSSDGSLHKTKSTPGAIIISTTEIEISPPVSPLENSLHRRPSCRAPDDSTLNGGDDVDDDDDALPEQPQLPLTHRMTADSGVRPWPKAAQTDTTRKAARDKKKRLTWNDLHGQWSNHASRLAYHGQTPRDPSSQKPNRLSIKRLTMLFPDWNIEDK